MELNDAARRRRLNFWVRAGILIIGSIYVTGIIYGGGMKGQKKIADAINERRKTAEQNLRLAQLDLRVRLAAAQQLEARRQIALALTQPGSNSAALVARAAQLLQAANDANTSTPDFAPEIADLKAIGDAAGYNRARLEAVARRMDDALDKEVPGFLENAQTSDAAHPIQKPSLNDIPLLPGNDVTRTE